MNFLLDNKSFFNKIINIIKKDLIMNLVKFITGIIIAIIIPQRRAGFHFN